MPIESRIASLALETVAALVQAERHPRSVNVGAYGWLITLIADDAIELSNQLCSKQATLNAMRRD